MHLWLNPADIRGQVRLEAPCKFARGFGTARSLSVGAFSYTWSFLSGNVGAVGRYCSIAEDVGFGHMEHPVDWLSTSSFTYGPEIFAEYTERKGRTAFESSPLPPERKRQPIEIGHDVWIGHRAYIRSGTHLGNGCIIGTHAVVTKDVAPYAVAVGNPARVIKYRFDEALIDRLQRLQWWDFDFTDFSGVSVHDVQRACDRLESLIAGGLRRHRPTVVHIVGDGTPEGLRFTIESAAA